MSTLYERIIELCDTRGITGYKLCKDTGLTPSVVTDLKMGRKKGLSAKNADKIAKYFGVSVGYLLGDENSPPVRTLSDEDEQDISLKLKEALDQLMSGQEGLMFDGEPLDRETMELLETSLRNSIEFARRLTRQKAAPEEQP